MNTITGYNIVRNIRNSSPALAFVIVFALQSRFATPFLFYFVYIDTGVRPRKVFSTPSQ